MNAKNICTLNGGGWPPKETSDGHQLQNSISFSNTKNQLDGAVFSAEETQQIRRAIRKKYGAVANSAKGFFTYPVGKKGADLLGYDRQLLEELPEALLNSFCGVGNPLAIDQIESGSSVLDIGCGAGFDLHIASCQVGSKGKVFGVDLTPEMVDRARKNLAAAKVTNTEVLLVASEQMPFADHTFDVVISNGVINLSPDKPTLFAEIYRILKPGGRLQFADIILEKNLPPHLAANVESWSQWIGGAVSGGDQQKLMRQAGLTEVVHVSLTPVKTSDYTVGATFKGIKPYQ